MATKKKSKTRKKTSPREAIHDTLNRLEKELPPNLSGMVRQMRRSMLDLEKQIDKTRKDSERRWERQQIQLRRDLASMLRRLEKAVAPTPNRKPRKATHKKTSPASRPPSGEAVGKS